MKVLYVRTSTVDQKTDRQRVQESAFDYVVEDKISGAVPFFERPGGIQIQHLTERGDLTELSIWQIDRLGRDVRDIINTIHYFTKKGISIHFVSQSLKTLDSDGKENPISKLIINVLGVVAEMNRNQIRENQLQGIAIAKAKGKFLGRKKGSKEDTLKFLSKPKNKKALDLLNKGYKAVEVSKIVGLHANTISKIKKLTIDTGS